MDMDGLCYVEKMSRLGELFVAGMRDADAIPCAKTSTGTGLRHRYVPTIITSEGESLIVNSMLVGNRYCQRRVNYTCSIETRYNAITNRQISSVTQMGPQTPRTESISLLSGSSPESGTILGLRFGAPPLWRSPMKEQHTGPSLLATACAKEPTSVAIKTTLFSHPPRPSSIGEYGCSKPSKSGAALRVTK